jgi:hypothetical protein
MNIYEKLQKCKVGVQAADPKKTGLNKHTGASYFELGDFMPIVNRQFIDNGLIGLVQFESEKATLTIINTEKPEEQYVYSSPSVNAKLQGGQEIQNIGATQTYLRRYLYMNALDITESDPLDSGEHPAPENPEDLGESKIDSVKIQTLQSMLRKTNTDEKMLMKYYGVDDEDVKNVTISVFSLAMAALQKKLEKQPEKPKEEPII